MASKCKNKQMSRKVRKIKERKVVERTSQLWGVHKEHKDEYIREEFKLLEEFLIKLGYCIVTFLLLYLSYSILYNYTRERVEGNSRNCAKLCGRYLSFDLEDVYEASYPTYIFPNPWSIPNRDRDIELKRKACRSLSQ